MKKLISLGLFCALSALSAVAGATQYSTTPTGNYTQYMSDFTTAYGQLFTLPTTQALQSWTFDLHATAGTAVAGNIDLEIAAWDSATQTATGPIVYASPTPTYWSATSTDTPVTWNNINTTLQGGTEYVVYMTLATPGATTQSFISGAANQIGAYDGGFTSFASNVVWGNSDGIDPLFDPSSWNDYPANYPALQFSATTTATTTSTSNSSVPAPGVALLSVLALLGLGVLSARRQRI